MMKILKNLKTNRVSTSPTYDSLQLWALINKSHQRLYNIMHIFAIIFIITQYIELYIIKENLELAMRNLSVTMLSTVCIFKAVTFVFWQKHWLQIFEFASNLEKIQLSKKNSKTKSIIVRYATYSRKITYFYSFLITATVLLVILAPLFSFLTSTDQVLIKNGSIPYPEILSSWFPFDSSNGIGYLVAVAEHSIMCLYGGCVVINFDCNAVIIMSFFAGQLNLIKFNCEHLFDIQDNELICYDKAINRIKECHYHHLQLVKYSSMFNSLLYPVMFLYVIICSLMICASAMQLTRDSTGNMQRIWITEYLIAIIAQLFLYCWHSNEILYTSNKVSDGVYFSLWYTMSPRVRRSLLLLDGQLRKSIVFKAGPFTKLDVASFVAILKGAYSYYTLLDKKED